MWVSDSYEHIFSRAQSNLARGNYEAAYADYQRLSDRLAKLKPAVLDRRPELHNLLLIGLARQAEIHHFRGEFEPAMQLYQRLIETAPQRRDNWQRNIALVRIDMGQTEAGMDELRAQAVAHPADFGLWLTIGLECEALGRLDEAEENLQRAARRAVEANDQANAYLALFDFYRGQGRVAEALAAWEQAWATHGHEPSYVFPVYQMMRETGDMERAHAYLGQEKNPLRKGFYQGVLATDEGKSDEATRHWKRVAKMNPLEFDEGHEAWAEAALRVDWPPQEVIGALARIWESGNLNLQGLLLQAVAEARIGHLDHAQNALDVARSIRLRSRPRQETLSIANWTLFDELVADAEIKRQLRHYFEPEPQPEAQVVLAGDGA